MSDATPQPDPAVTALTAKAGDKVDNYTIMEQVGAGGTAIVFRGHDHVLNRNVAIKQLIVPPGESGDELRQRALAEAAVHKRAAANDPKLLVQYIDTINDPRGIFMISEYVDGPPLEWILQNEPQPMEQRQALGIIAATAKALDALHQAGIVHRDLKPSNILMPREGGLKIADFGLAAVIAEQQSMDLGSVRYMAPEVLQGQTATPKSDLYSLGMIAYEIIAGRERFNEAFRTILRDQRNQSMRWVKWHTNVRAKVPSLDQLVEGVPESLAQLVARMMEKDPARRVGSAAELIDAIRSHFAQGGQAAQSPSPHAAMAPPQIDDTSQTQVIPQRSKLPLILAVTLVVWVLAIGGFFLIKNQQRQAQADQTRTAMIRDIEEADALIVDQKYKLAIEAFTQIPLSYADQFDANNRRYRDDLVEAGLLKAQALLAAQQDDFVDALDHARDYQKRMTNWAKQPLQPRTSLSLINAKDMVDQYDTRAAFQQLADEINAMLLDGKLDDAIQAIRLARQSGSLNAAAEDLERLNQLEASYKQMLGNKRVTTMIEQAKQLSGSGELREAITLLDSEMQREGEKVDERVTKLLADLNKQMLIQTVTEDVTRAERTGDNRKLLEMLKTLHNIQPTQALDTRIKSLEVVLMIEQAEAALAEGRPEKAQQYLNDIQERDPNNEQAKRMLAVIESSRMMTASVSAGDQLMAEGNYAEAIKKYKEALTHGPDTDDRIQSKIIDATGQIHLANSLAAYENDQVELAQEELDKAKESLGVSATINDLQADIDDLRDYTTLMAEAEIYFTRNDFGRAKAKYLNAKKIRDSEMLAIKISDCDFGIWLDQCDRAISTRDWEGAESALKRAEDIKRNEQTQDRRKKIDSRA